MLPPNMTSLPHLLFPSRSLTWTAGSRAGKKKRESPHRVDSGNSPSLTDHHAVARFSLQSCKKGNTWEPAHFLSPAPGTDTITVGIHPRPLEMNPRTHSLSLHLCREELVQGQCPEESSLSRGEQAGVAVVMRETNASTLARSSSPLPEERTVCYQAASVQSRAESQALTANLRHLVSRHFPSRTGLASRRRAYVLNSKPKLLVLSFPRYLQLRFQESAAAIDAPYP